MGRTTFEFSKLSLEGAYAIKNFYYEDIRGNFIKSYEKEIYENAGISFEMSETFVSVSCKNVIRGLHFQFCDPQAKLICLLKGEAWDVIVDLRRSSPTYKQWISVDLRSGGSNAVYIPPGFAHGFASLTDDMTMLYQCAGKYDKSTDTGILFNDETIGVKWPIDISTAVLSDRDAGLMKFDEFERKADYYGKYQ